MEIINKIVKFYKKKLNYRLKLEKIEYIELLDSLKDSLELKKKTSKNNRFVTNEEKFRIEEEFYKSNDCLDRINVQ